MPHDEEQQPDPAVVGATRLYSVTSLADLVAATLQVASQQLKGIGEHEGASVFERFSTEILSYSRGRMERARRAKIAVVKG